jgi:hypothetical protein
MNLRDVRQVMFQRAEEGRGNDQLLFQQDAFLYPLPQL